MYSLEVKITVASRFNCQSIGHLEEDYLNIGNVILESHGIESCNTEFDATIAVALVESLVWSAREQEEQISSDEAITEYLSADKATDRYAEDGSSVNDILALGSVE